MAGAERHKIRQYLLGQLTEAEDEQVEMRLLTEPDFAEEHDIVVNEVIDDYVAGRFKGEDLKQVEEYFFKSQQRRNKLKFALALKQRKSEMVTIKGFKQKSSRPYLAIAATLLLVFGGFSIWRALSSRNQLDEGLAALKSAFRDERPLESRISGFTYARFISTRGPGDEKFDNNDLSLAELTLRQELKDRPSPAAHYALGKVFLAKKDFDGAIKEFDEAIKGDPNNAQLYSDLGAALIEKGALDKAGPEPGKGWEELARGRENLVKALSFNPTLLEALFNRALCSEYQLMRQQAKEDWKAYLKADSNSRWAIEGRERLRKLEEQVASSSRSSEQLPLEFFAAYQSRNDEAAWAALSRGRARSGNTIVEALVDDYLHRAKSAQTSEANDALQQIAYAGKVEVDKIADRFTSDLAQFYQRTNPDHRDRLVQARALMKDAQQLYIKSEFESAGEVYLQAREAFVELGDECEALIAESFVGYCALRIPETQKSIEIFERLSREFQGRGYRYLFGQTLSALADAQWSRGEFSKTLDYAARGLKVSAEIQDASLGVRCLAQNITTHMVLGDYRRSLQSLSEAVQLADTLAPNPSLTWQLYNQASFDFHFLGFPSSALAFQQEALHLALAANNPLLKARTWDQMGVLYGEQKNYDEAIKSGEKAVAEGQAIKDEKSRNNVIARSTLILGKLHLAAGHQRLAIQNFDESISIYQTLKFHVYFYEAHKGKLRAFLELHNDSAAEAELKTVLALFDQNWKKISEESNRDAFFDAGQDTYDIAADFAYSRLNDKKRAFEYAEASRARSLLEMMNRGARVKDGRNAPDIDLASHTDSLTLDQIQSGMPERAQLVLYSLLPDKLLVWVITKRDIKSESVALDQAEFDRKVHEYRKLVVVGSSGDDETRRAAARELYSRLISPVETMLDPQLPVFISADKSLHFLPFDTLISPVSGKYLIDNYSIAMVPSASVLIRSSEYAKKKIAAPDDTILSIGNPNFDQSAFPGLPGLPGADREARGVGAYYRYRTVLVGPEASAGRVADELKKADVIHIATHAVADPRSPLMTKLLLAGARQDGVSSNHARSGFLQASQIYELKLPRARLVVLSACQTGIERAYRGEGAIGLARPFLVAGVPIVVASLWPVDSESTAELMIRFHEHRTRGHKTTIEALRQAKRDMIYNPPPGSQETFGWAAFVAIGGYADF